ncbi:hypothetical protein [Haliscomenobacter hydrossis]|uniref:Dihydrofolate reductase n=1 Tax=Haliscomenobacter hydrossis (strain ATCC 27775 / DSM 1100 / LMG 10767 / O) TaxID=760192 RepID=F4KZF4_HALH1|nr:hypothetical protein [Haliscomenobacter hydrossis]AEE48449.1 hypothetical protein Halhy_0539 [Haliscomenobacter hydrossis DSM 1100]
MRKLIMWNIITLDGYFEGTQNWDLPFHHVVWGQELEKLSIEQLNSADYLVFGRVTYEGMAAHWIKEEGEIAEHIYIEEPSGIIWVTARGSTTRFDPSVPLPNPQTFTVFTPANGLNCCVQSMYQDKAGNMRWGAGQGLFRFDGQRFYQVKQHGPW